MVAAAMVEAGAINTCSRRPNRALFNLTVIRVLDEFPVLREFAEPVWNHFKTRLFSLQPAARFNIDIVTTEGFLP